MGLIQMLPNYFPACYQAISILLFLPILLHVNSMRYGTQVSYTCERDVVDRMNEGYRAWGAMKSVLSNRGLGIKAKQCLYEGVIVPIAL